VQITPDSDLNESSGEPPGFSATVTAAHPKPPLASEPSAIARVATAERGDYRPARSRRGRLHRQPTSILDQLPEHDFDAGGCCGLSAGATVDRCASTYASLAEVLDLAAKPDQAADALREALARYEQKGNVVMSRRIREQLQGTT
jgi:hypothetical protein